jgi:hypothetical protein
MTLSTYGELENYKCILDSAFTRADACSGTKGRERLRARDMFHHITFYVEHDPEPSQDDPEPSQGNAGHGGSFAGSTIGIPSKRGEYAERQFPDGGVGGIDGLAAADAASSSMVSSMVSNAAMSFLLIAALLPFSAFLPFSSALLPFAALMPCAFLPCFLACFLSATRGSAMSMCCRWQVQEASVYPDALGRCVGCRQQRPGGCLLPARADHLIEPHT